MIKIINLLNSRKESLKIRFRFFEITITLEEIKKIGGSRLSYAIIFF